MEANSVIIDRYKPRGATRLVRALGASIRGLRGAFREEAAFRQGFVSLAQLEAIIGQIPNCEYRAYLETDVIAEAKRLQK